MTVGAGAATVRVGMVRRRAGTTAGAIGAAATVPLGEDGAVEWEALRGQAAELLIENGRLRGHHAATADILRLIAHSAGGAGGAADQPIRGEGAVRCPGESVGEEPETAGRPEGSR